MERLGRILSRDEALKAAKELRQELGRGVVVPKRVATINWEAELKAKYRDLPPPKLSAKALGLPSESLRPLKPGSKWGLPE
jgi:hypothetical protein